MGSKPANKNNHENTKYEKHEMRTKDFVISLFRVFVIKGL